MINTISRQHFKMSIVFNCILTNPSYLPTAISTQLSKQHLKLKTEKTRGVWKLPKVFHMMSNAEQANLFPFKSWILLKMYKLVKKERKKKNKKIPDGSVTTASVARNVLFTMGTLWLRTPELNSKYVVQSSHIWEKKNPQKTVKLW